MLKFGHIEIIPFPQNYYPNRLQLHSMRDVEVPNINKEATNIDGYFETLDEGIEVDRMLNEGFKDDWQKFMEDASKPVYDTCKFSHLTTILVLLNLQTVHGWIIESVDDLLAFLHELLPPNSTLSKKWRECESKISNLGLRYENIHTCVNGCILFRKNPASET